MNTLRLLHVFVNGKPVGRLDEVQEADGVPPVYRFSYVDALSKQDAVSVTMPTTTPTFVTRRIPPIFTQNMPEGNRLLSLMKAGKIIRLDDHFGVIAATGAITIGRVRVSPTETLGTEQFPDVTEKDGRETLLKILQELGLNQGVSGVQPKVLAQIPRTLYGERTIAKTFNPEEYPDLALNEYHTLSAARMSGVLVPTVKLSTDETILIVDRFDVRENTFLGLEEATTLTSLTPEEKYLGSYESVGTAIEKFVVDKPLAMAQFFRVLLFNCVVRNGDAHAKNFAILVSDDNTKFAPSYDLVTTGAYFGPGESESPALALAWDNFSKKWWTRKELEIFASESLLLSKKEISNIFDDVSAGVEKALSDLPAKPTTSAMKTLWETGLQQYSSEMPRPRGPKNRVAGIR